MHWQEAPIKKAAATGLYWLLMGVGMGNFKESKLATLAKKGNGNFAYLDNINEAEKVLIKELTQTFFAVADDVFMNLKFNADLVKEYRLIGFDNRRDAVADSTIDLEGGELGSGNSVLAIFEIVPAGDKLFKPDTFSKDVVAEIEMRYSLCNDTALLAVTNACLANYIDFKSIDKDLQFATAVTMFGLKLKQSKYAKAVDWMDIEKIARDAYNPGCYLQTEFLEIITKAEDIYSTKKRKKTKRD
jgi:Ca-activated chloride channel family protein